MSKGSKKTKSDSDKRYFAAYNDIKQRQKRKDRHLRKHPNDGQAKKAKPAHRRTKPLNKGGWLNRQMANSVYIGKIAGKDESAITILNSLTKQTQFAMARYSAMIRATHNRFRFEKQEKKINPLTGYAG